MQRIFLQYLRKQLNCNIFMPWKVTSAARYSTFTLERIALFAFYSFYRYRQSMLWPVALPRSRHHTDPFVLASTKQRSLNSQNASSEFAYLGDKKVGEGSWASHGAWLMPCARHQTKPVLGTPESRVKSYIRNRCPSKMNRHRFRWAR